MKKVTPKLVDLTTGKEPFDNMDSNIDGEDRTRKLEIIWPNVAFFTVVNIAAIYGLWNLFANSETLLRTFFFLWVYGGISALGVTAASHRLWTHRCYKATLPLRIILMLMQSVSMQNNIYVWVRDHRVHHKYTDTDADPHNSKRGFFFSHMGWLMVKKHPDVKRRGLGIDMSDVLSDPVVRFQMRYELILNLVFSIIIPIWIPIYFWNETFNISFFSTVSRWVVSLHITWFVNSAAHMWGSKPYDKSISSTENLFVGILAYGEGWHNYHHVYPWDYKAAELGNYMTNWTTAFIDFCAFLGLAYELKTVPEEQVKKRITRTGDENHSQCDNIWGWDDLDLTKEDKEGTQIFAKGHRISDEL